MNRHLPTRYLREDPRETAAVAKELARITQSLTALGANRVLLFGSRARGEARRGSDSDLMVVMPCPLNETYATRLTRIARAIRSRIAVDLLVYTPEEFERLRATRPFVQQAVREGVVLHGD